MNSLVYVLDDDREAAEHCAGILKGLGHTVEVSEDADNLLSAMRTRAPDAVFLDLMMPGVDGLTLCRRIREDPAFQPINVVIMSAKKFAADKASAVRVGANAYLEKPYGEPQVRAVLNNLATQVEVRFWGVRGSIAAPGPANRRYGGNTSCVAVRLGVDEYIVLDAGTGIRELGNYLMRLGRPVHVHLFISHPHWDHIQGLPFFRPGYEEQNHIDIYGADQPDTPLEKVISDQMHSTYFPVPLEAMGANLRFHSLQEGPYDLKACQLETFYLKHPGTTLGFRVKLRGKAMVYLCDNEITEDDVHFRKRLVSFVKDADLLIADAQYTAEDFPAKRGWGHSLYTDVVDVALDAGVRRLVLTHHDPDRHDDDLDEIAEASRARVAGRGAKLDVCAAMEGTALYL